MNRVVLLRHAATNWSGTRFCGRTDLPLSYAGRAQVDGLVDHLARAHLAVDVVRSSPARRAVETAARLSDLLKARLGSDDRLREVDFGRAEACSFEDLVRLWPEIAAALLAGDTEIDWPGGESASDIARRLRPVAEELGRLENDALLVTHGGVIRVLLTLLDVAGGAHMDLAPARFVVLERRAAWHLVDASPTADHSKEGAPAT